MITLCDFTQISPFANVGRTTKGKARMDIQDTRRRRLELLESEVGGQKALIEITGLAQAYLSNLKHNRSKFGEKTARKIEKLAGKPYLWLDDVDVTTAHAAEVESQIRLILDSVPDNLRQEVVQRLKDKK